MIPTYASDEERGNGQYVSGQVRLEDVFEVDPHADPIVSSGRKRILRGRYRGKDGKDVAACALVFKQEAARSFGTECTNLGLCSTIGVGPKLLDVLYARVGSGLTRYSIIIEEDAGRSLAYLLRQAAKNPSEPVLHPIGTPERGLENLKVTFDVFSQVINAHRHNLYHCDLRCENVCVRRFGERPEDIRATIVDIDLGTTLEAGRPKRTASLYDTLFRKVPTWLAHGVLGTPNETRIDPSPLEMDLAYLAALLFHLERGDTVLNDRSPSSRTLEEFVSFVELHVPFFGYVADALGLSIRRLDEDADLFPVASQLGLKEVCERNFPNDELLRLARSYNRRYLDGADMRSFEESEAVRLLRLTDELAHAQFRLYNEARRSRGLQVDYETFESQPEDLISSTYDQMAHVPAKVAALGYKMRGLGQASAGDAICSLTDDQVETLARMEHARWVRERLGRGWTRGERDHARKTSPYLVPYDELPEDIKELNRDAARGIIPLLETVGIAVVRPS